MEHRSNAITARAARAARALTAIVTVMIALAMATAPAWAHVEAKASEPDDTGAMSVDFSFEHGCDGAATTGLRVKIPEGARDVEPQDQAGWKSGFEDSVVEWSGSSIPGDTPGSFTLKLKLDAAPGETVYFPTIQACGDKENSWIGIPTAVEPDPENVAPSIIVPDTGGPLDDSRPDVTGTGEMTEATAQQTTGTAQIMESTASTLTGTAVTSTSQAKTGSGSSNVLPVIIGVAVVVAVVAAALIIRSRQKR